MREVVRDVDDELLADGSNEGGPGNGSRLGARELVGPGVPHVAVSVIDVCRDDLQTVLADGLSARFLSALQRQYRNECGNRDYHGEHDERKDGKTTLVAWGHVCGEAHCGLLSRVAGCSTTRVPPCPAWKVQTKW